MLTAGGGAGVVFLLMTANLCQHGVLHLEASAFRQQIESLPIVQIIKELAVGADAWESKAIGELPFPKPSQSAMGNVLITAHKSNELGGRRKPVSQNRCENV